MYQPWKRRKAIINEQSSHHQLEPVHEPIPIKLCCTRNVVHSRWSGKDWGMLHGDHLPQLTLSLWYDHGNLWPKKQTSLRVQPNVHDSQAQSWPELVTAEEKAFLNRHSCPIGLTGLGTWPQNLLWAHRFTRHLQQNVHVTAHSRGGSPLQTAPKYFTWNVSLTEKKPN